MNPKRFLFLCGIAAGITWVLRTYAFEAIYISTASMEPTLPVGIHLFVDKITYSFRGPSRGEVIAFASPVPPYERDLVKRVIAIGGDTVEIKDKAVLVNGKELEESYARHSRPQERLMGDNLGPLQVPAGQVFVLGDNRDESDDSSVWKDPKTGERIYFVPLSKVRGVVRGAY
jgi:signal peptidase I